MNITMLLFSIVSLHYKSDWNCILALSWDTKDVVIDGQVCFHIWLFADPVKP